MISGYQQGRLLTIISKILQPKNILEIGTFTGYAALCMAEGLSKDGKLTTLDVNEDLAYLPEKYFTESEFSGQIHFKIQDAKELGMSRVFVAEWLPIPMVTGFCECEFLHLRTPPALPHLSMPFGFLRNAKLLKKTFSQGKLKQKLL